MFVKISNEIFFGFNNDKNNSILKQLNYNSDVILIMYYLYINKNLDGISLFSLDDMIIESGYKPRTGNGKINDVFKQNLISLHNMGAIKLYNLNTVKGNHFNKCEILKDLENNFFILEDKNKNKIINYEDDKIDKSKVLMFYCYILSRIYNRNTDITISGGKAKACYPSYELIQDEIGLSDGSIKKYIDILIELDLIRVDNAGIRYYKKDNKKLYGESANTYVIYEEGWEIEMREAIKAYKLSNNNFEFTDSKRKSDRSIAGYISRINQLEREGKASKEQIEKRDYYLEIKESMKNIGDK